MEFLRSLLRRRFARAQVATSRNVGCFFRLKKNTAKQSKNTKKNQTENALKCSSSTEGEISFDFAGGKTNQNQVSAISQNTKE